MWGLSAGCLGCVAGVTLLLSSGVPSLLSGLGPGLMDSTLFIMNIVLVTDVKLNHFDVYSLRVTIKQIRSKNIFNLFKLSL